MTQRTDTPYIGRPCRLLVDGSTGVIVDHDMATGRADVELDGTAGRRVNLAACQLQVTGDACPITWQGATDVYRCSLGAGHLPAPIGSSSHGHRFTIRTVG